MCCRNQSSADFTSASSAAMHQATWEAIDCRDVGIITADNQQRKGLDVNECLACKVGPSAAAHGSVNKLAP